MNVKIRIRIISSRSLGMVQGVRLEDRTRNGRIRENYESTVFKILRWVDTCNHVKSLEAQVSSNN